MTQLVPAEAVEISPEALEVANTYLQLQKVEAVADALDIPVDRVTSILDRREVKAYIDNIFFNTGFNNRFTIRRAMDAIIQQKFKELEESESGSGKDIAELLELSHKMTMQELDRVIALEKLKHSSIKTQTNVQINGGGTNYDALIERLLKPASR